MKEKTIYKSKKEVEFDDLSEKWESIYREFPNYPHPMAPHKDILNIRLYNLKFNLEWKIWYLLQLENTWHKSDNPNIATFKIIKSEIEKIISFIGKTLACIELITSLFDVKSLLQKKNYDLTDINYEIQILHSYIWKDLVEIELEMVEIRTTISHVIFEFNQRKEGEQIVTGSEPYYRFGERAGISDLTCGSINSLFREYCGSFGKGKDLEWKGLVSISSGYDFGIYPKYQILHVPSHFHSHIYDKLIPIAHEAGHYVLGNLYKRTGIYSKFKAKIWKNLFKHTMEEIGKVENKFKEIGIEEKVNNHEEVLKELSKIRNHLNQTKRDELFTDLEVLIDIYAGLVGGPGYFSSLARLSFIPSTVYTTNLTHPRPWMRLFLGLELCMHLGYNVEEWGIKEIYQNAKDHEYRLSDQETFFKSNTDNILDNWWFEEFKNFRLDNFGNSLLLDLHTYLIKAIIKNTDIFDNMRTWMKVHLRILFFEDSIGNVKDLCEDIAKRIGHKSEIVMDQPLRYIAAASILPPIKRPYYPSGRIIHSLFYNENATPFRYNKEEKKRRDV